jgi:hypothetical protein
MSSIQPLAPEALRTQRDPARFVFATTTEFDDLTQVLGLTRAMEALKFDIGILRRDGYNLFVVGESDAGSQSPKELQCAALLTRYTSSRPGYRAHYKGLTTNARYR